MNKIKYILFVILFFIINFNVHSASIKIITKVENEIITNIDIKNEKKYLIFLNQKLKELNDNKIDEIAKNSLINEIIKLKELEKYYDFALEDEFFNSIEKKFLRQNRIKNKNEFIDFLNKKDLSYDIIKKKLKIEAYWNQLIYKKYKRNVKINKDYLSQSVLKQYKTEDKKYEYNLSEILFSETLNEDLSETVKKISNSISKIGFENTANIWSVSSTSKNGGLIGWVNELQISELIKKNIADLKINQISEPIKIKGGYLIIKLNNKREFNEKVDIENQIDELIRKETNRQLNAFSNIYYKKLKKGIIINEF